MPHAISKIMKTSFKHFPDIVKSFSNLEIFSSEKVSPARCRSSQMMEPKVTLSN